MLSSYIYTEENWGNVNSINKSDRCTASWLVYASAIYSDSHDEHGTAGCFFEFHVTGPPANMYKYPETERELLESSLWLASEYP